MFKPGFASGEAGQLKQGYSETVEKSQKLDFFGKQYSDEQWEDSGRMEFTAALAEYFRRFSGDLFEESQFNLESSDKYTQHVGEGQFESAAKYEHLAQIIEDSNFEDKAEVGIVTRWLEGIKKTLEATGTNLATIERYLAEINELKASLPAGNKEKYFPETEN